MGAALKGRLSTIISKLSSESRGFNEESSTFEKLIGCSRRSLFPFLAHTASFLSALFTISFTIIPFPFLPSLSSFSFLPRSLSTPLHPRAPTLHCYHFYTLRILSWLPLLKHCPRGCHIRPHWQQMTRGSQQRPSHQLSTSH